MIQLKNRCKKGGYGILNGRFLRQATFYLLIFMIAVALIQTFSKPQEVIHDINYYPDFINLIETGQLKKVTLTGDNVEGLLANGEKVRTFRPPDDDLTARLIENKIPYDPGPEPSPPWWSTLLTYLIPFILIIGLFFFFMQQSQGGGNRVMNFGKSRARLHDGERRKVTFDHVAGADEEKEELREIVEFLKEPKKFLELGARIPKGVLLVGPPGTGKTLLARAVAGEAGVPFFSISGSDFVEMFVGVGASRVRDLFDNAKRNSPCIVFIDEIDAVGRQRGAGLGGGHDEREQTLNQLLVEMDGFDVNEGIIILAATNRPDILDPALLRPGRFDRQITVNFPDVKGREEILQVHSRGKPLDSEVDLKVLARRTPGFTGADLENLVNEAALLAARRNKKSISMNEMEEAIDRVIAGTEKRSKVISEFEKKIVAFHESGHALVGYLLPHTDPVHKVSIIPRGRAGGYTLMLPEEDRYYMTRSELLARVATLLAGRVAEQVVFNEISTGAQNDLERATSIVRQMIMEYGMSDELGPITLGRKHDQIFLGRDLARDRDFSEEIAKSIDKEIRRTVDKAYRMAEDLIIKNRDKLEMLATALLEKETLDAEEIENLMEGKTLSNVQPEEETSQETQEDAKNQRIREKRRDMGEKVKVVFRPEKGEIYPKPGEEV
ncbi:MAG: ATP-dependent metallopeptidase FtsH/Yme1/Tma family protein [Firmicutes bacterium]|nr:ATP-dependent metallopeptidase FtsH/Yme1/Tma family protein [Bacillota bacterium]